MAGTTKPSGLAIVRDNNLKFALSWKIGDKDYGAGHQLRYRAWKSEKKHTGWTTVTMGAKVTQKTITLSEANWYPASKKPKLYYFEFEVRGKRSGGYDWSAWAAKKWKISVPPKPSVSVEVSDRNVDTYTWSVKTSKKDAKPFKDVKYESMLVKDCTETKGEKLKWKSKTGNDWKTGTGSASGSLRIPEDTTTIATGSHTRWFRCCARGAKGASAWVYKKHVFAAPKKATIDKTTFTVKDSTTTVYVKWTAGSDAAHPIDETRVQYCIGEPVAGFVCPGSPTDAVTQKDTSGTDAANFIINDTLAEDQCLWVRVTNCYDENETPSAWALVQAGTMKAPTAMTVTYNDSTNIAAVTALTKGTNITDARHAVVYRGSDGEDVIVGIIESNASTLSGIKVPAGTASPSFGIFAFQGAATEKSNTDGVKIYSIVPNMQSEILWQGGTVPSAPSDFTADRTESEGEALLTWDWSWDDANKAELSWSTNPNAWESTNEPSTYVVDSIRAARWRVSGLETGRVWYFRIRLLNETENSTIYGPYSEQRYVDLSAAPDAPVLELSNAVVAPGGELTATWVYTSRDGTEQVSASVFMATVNGSTVTPVSEIASAQTAQHADIDTSGWTTGETYLLCVRVTSASGMTSEWSDPIAVYVAEPMECTIAATSLEEIEVTDEDENARTTLALTEMPLTVTITGAGEGGTTTLIIERADEYHMERPDGSMRDGYEGETIVLYRQTGEDQISIGVDSGDLYGVFDDGAPYRLIATVSDGFGQSDTQEIEFEVHWVQQAVVPSVTVRKESGVAVISATVEDAGAGATCDIYRLSADKPQLIVQSGAFETEYVDPFPALGINGGYRVVCVTANGDYIADTEDGEMPAWEDALDNLFDNKTGYIHFNGEVIPIQFNVKLSSNWKKDFKETKYLGGTVRGDWNPAVSRTCTINVTIPSKDTEAIQQMRRLADWSGICHVRSQDGSSYAADIQVSGSTSYSVAGKVEDYTLSITRITPEELDGIPYSEWVTA